MHKTILFALVILSGLSAGALAANQVIHQQGRVFSSESVTIKKGDAPFKETGNVQVICAIHPRMKMMVQVTD